MLTPPKLFVALFSVCLLCLGCILYFLPSPLVAGLLAAVYSAAGGGVYMLLVRDAQGKLPPMLRLPPVALPALGRLGRALVLGLAALAVFVGLPPLVRLAYPTFGGFAPDTLNAATLGAFQFFAALTMAYAAWRWLFPSLYAYAAETMEGKLLEAITTDLLTHLPTAGQWDTTDALAGLAERRRIATLQFTVRCARFVFSIAPFVFFFWQANQALASALIAVPSGGPGL